MKIISYTCPSEDAVASILRDRLRDSGSNRYTVGWHKDRVIRAGEPAPCFLNMHGVCGRQMLRVVGMDGLDLPPEVSLLSYLEGRRAVLTLKSIQANYVSMVDGKRRKVVVTAPDEGPLFIAGRYMEGLNATIASAFLPVLTGPGPDLVRFARRAPMVLSNSELSDWLEPYQGARELIRPLPQNRVNLSVSEASYMQV